jgi:hypothetical protein
MNDSSDWWSMLNERSPEVTLKPQHREPASSNFQILGVELEQGFTELAGKLGQARVVERGDGAAGRSQLCYESAGDSGAVHLIFEHGEINYSFYLFAGGANWKGDDLCLKSKRVSRGLKTASGLALGLTPNQLETILGGASSRTKDKLVYEFEVDKTTSTEQFEQLRKRFPDRTEKQLHESYDRFTLSVFVEARFDASGLNYLVVSKSEVY